MNPTADDIAVAIVAACRETGGDPIACAQRDTAPATANARHYALHALRHVFRAIAVYKLCVHVGAPVTPKKFWLRSWHDVATPPNSSRLGRGRIAPWWDEAAYDRVIQAIEADRTRRNAAPPASPEVSVRKLPAAEPRSYRPPPGTVERVLAETRAPAARLGRLEPGDYRPPPDAIQRILEDDDRPVMDRGSAFSGPKPGRDYGAPKGKVDLQAELRAAVMNTAKLPTQG